MNPGVVSPRCRSPVNRWFSGPAPWPPPCLSPRFASLLRSGTPPMAAGFGRVTSRTLAWRTSTSPTYRSKSEYEDLAFALCPPVGGAPAAWSISSATCPDANGDEAPPAEPLVLSTTHLQWNCCRRTLSGGESALAPGRAPRLLQSWIKNMRRDGRSCPCRNMGAGRSEQRISLTDGQSFALLQSLATHKTSVVLPLLGPLVRLSPVIR